MLAWTGVPMGVPLSQYTDTEAHAHMQRLADETNQYTPTWTTACVHIYNAEPTGKRPPAGTRISGGYESHILDIAVVLYLDIQDLRLTDCGVTQTPNPTHSCRVLVLPSRPTKVGW